MILLDAGLVTELDAVDRRNFLDLFTAVAVGDGRLAAQLMIERSRYGFLGWACRGCRCSV